MASKVKARKSFLFTENIFNSNTIILTVYTFYYSVKSYSVLFQRVENEKIISQIVRISEVCDQNGDSV